MEEDEWQRQLEKEDNIIVKWAQEDVETLHNLLNNNNNNNNNIIIAATCFGPNVFPSSC